MKKIRVKNEMEELAAKVGVAMGDDSDDDDDDGEDRMDVDVKIKGALGEEDDEGSSGTFPSSLISITDND